jgi:hypothetical protein
MNSSDHEGGRGSVAKHSALSNQHPARKILYSISKPCQERARANVDWLNAKWRVLNAHGKIRKTDAGPIP